MNGDFKRHWDQKENGSRLYNSVQLQWLLLCCLFLRYISKLHSEDDGDGDCDGNGIKCKCGWNKEGFGSKLN